MANPLASLFVTSPFGSRKPIKTTSGRMTSNYHNGVDLRAAVGTPVYAVKDGWVVEAGTSPIWGKYEVIKGDDGYTTRYAHLSSATAAKGARITAGTKIGLSGETGSVDGAHLHFGVYDPSGAAVDPLKYVNGIVAQTIPNVTGLNFNQPISSDMSAAAAIGLLGAALITMAGLLDA